MLDFDSNPALVITLWLGFFWLGVPFGIYEILHAYHIL